MKKALVGIFLCIGDSSDLTRKHLFTALIIIGLDFDIYVVFILIIEFDNDRLYLKKKTQDCGC